MAIDGTWRRECVLTSISENRASLTIEGPTHGLNLTEFFLLLSTTGVAFRRCELAGVNGKRLEVSFLTKFSRRAGRDASRSTPGLIRDL
jgi:hypothetical protein